MQFVRKNFLSIILICCILQGCSNLTYRVDYANSVAEKAGMKLQEINTGRFILTTYSKIRDKNQPVNIYIEGDGFAWASISRLSTNPTPKDAFALQLASEDPSENVVYIARPCQYTSFEKDKICAPKYWSGSRFSEMAVDSVNKAISSYAMQMEKPRINLIGYSGGAAIAVLVASRRSDIASLRTVAGNLDHVAINRYHKVDNLDDSLNPIDVAEKLASLPQYHFAGADDKIVPLESIKEFAKKADKGQGCVRVSSVNGATHDSGWKENWRELIGQPVYCKDSSNKIEKR